MVRIREAILVEGRYDKNTLSQIVDAPIFESSGFGIFKNQQQMALLRRVAESRGLIVFTDSDGHRVRDANLSKTFNIDISKEALIHEFARRNARQTSNQRIAERSGIPEEAGQTAGRGKRLAEKNTGRTTRARR